MNVPSTGVLLFLACGQFNIDGSCWETFWEQDGEGTRQMLCPILADLPPRGIILVVDWVVVNQVPSWRFVVNEVNSISLLALDVFQEPSPECLRLPELYVLYDLL